MAESKMTEFKMAAIIKLSQNELGKFFVQNGWIQDGWIQDGRIQDGCHHLVNWIELVWFRVRVEWECFWVNLREDNKVFESKMAVSESNMAEFKMSCHHQVESEWTSEVFFCAKWLNPRWPEFKMTANYVRIKAESKMAEFTMSCHESVNWKLVWVRVRMELRVLLSGSEWR